MTSRIGLCNAFISSQGQNIAIRDPLNHVMPLLFVEPKYVREQIVMAVATSSASGQLPYGVSNFGQVIENDSSDIGLYAINAAARYVLATGHSDFLHEIIRTPWGLTEVGDGLWKLASWYMTSFDAGGCGLGPHGLIRMHGGDYNDGIRSGCQMGGGKADESVLNSMMAVGIFRSWADVLEVVAMADSKRDVVGSSSGGGSGGGKGRSSRMDVATNISSLRAFASQQELAVSRGSLHRLRNHRRGLRRVLRYWHSRPKVTRTKNRRHGANHNWRAPNMK